MADTTKCQHMEPPNWQETCRFFGHNQEQSWPGYVVKVPKFDRKLLPVQAHSVWWALQTIHGDVGGIMICHAMGIGKTTIALAIHHVQHQINRMWACIGDEPGSHVPRGKDNQDPPAAQACPSRPKMRQQFGFECPCSPLSPTHFVKPKLGASVALVPLGLIKTWEHEWQECFGRSRTQKLYIAHAAFEKDNDKGTWDLLQGTEQPTMERATAVSPLYQPAEGSEEHEGPSIVTPRLANGTCFVVSTSQSVVKRFLDHQANKRQKNWVLQGKPYPRAKNDPSRGLATPRPVAVAGTPYQRCLVSMIFKDEFQHQPTEAEGAIELLQARQARAPASNIALIPMSGTPLTSGPLDIARYVQLMVKPSWKQHATLKRFMKKQVYIMGEQWRKAVLNVDKTNRRELRTIRAQVERELPPLVETLFVRSTTDSRIGRHPAIIVPACWFQTISCTHAEADQARANAVGTIQQADFDRREAHRQALYRAQHAGGLQGYTPLSKRNVNMFYRSRVCASFPGLADLLTDDGEPLKLTLAEWIENVDNGTWKPGTTSDPYYANFAMIVASSGKLTEIAKMLDGFDTRVDGEGKPCRHIFISYFFVVIYIFGLVGGRRSPSTVPHYTNPSSLVATQASDDPSGRYYRG